MSEHQRQTAFLKALILEEDTEEHRQLQEKIQQAERDERCICRAVRLVGVVSLLSLASLGYLAVLLPGFFDNSSHILIKFFAALSLGSAMCFVVFLGFWLWHRGLVNRALEDGRRCILAEHQVRAHPKGTAPVTTGLSETHATVVNLAAPSSPVAQTLPALSKAS